MWGLCVHPTSQKKFLRTLKQLTNRSNGKGYAWLKLRLSQYIRGWLIYYRYADMRQFLLRANGWYFRRLRMYIWKSWKRVRTKFTNLIKCGISKSQSWQWANTRKGYWRVAKSGILCRAITGENLIRAGYPSIVVIYSVLHRN